MSGLPPYATMLGLRQAEGRVSMAFGPHLIGAPGRLHGGAVAGLLEIAGNIALEAALNDPHVRLKPVDVTVDFLREGALEETHAEATIVRLGRRVANIRVEAWQSDRARLIAAARMNIMIDREDMLPTT